MSQIFLGTNPDNNAPIVQALESHCITFATNGSGKGVAQIIPNLKGPYAWDGSVVVIDPAGEISEICASWRQENISGDHETAIFDPFHQCQNEDLKPFLKTINVLELAETADDIIEISEGIIKRSANDPQPFFDNKAESTLAGLLAYIKEAPSIPDSERHLGTLASIFARIDAEDGNTINEMLECTKFGNLAARTAGSLMKTDSGTKNALTSLGTQLKWLSSEFMQNWLALPSSVDLRKLKTGKLSLFLVIPPKKLKDQGQYLRLFVQMAVSVMQDKTPDGKIKGTECLMILDEFYSLSRMQSAQVAFAQMRKYGLHLWPFLQDVGQLVELYGREGMQTFIANSDFCCFYGVNDVETAELASRMTGKIDTNDISSELMHAAEEFEESEKIRMAEPSIWNKYGLAKLAATDGFLGAPGPVPVVADQKLQSNIGVIRSKIGAPRVTPERVMQITAKPDINVPSKTMMLFKKGKFAFIKLSPFFAPTFDINYEEKEKLQIKQQKEKVDYARKLHKLQQTAWIWGWVIFLLCMVAIVVKDAIADFQG